MLAAGAATTADANVFRASSAGLATRQGNYVDVRRTITLATSPGNRVKDLVPDRFVSANVHAGFMEELHAGTPVSARHAELD